MQGFIICLVLVSQYALGDGRALDHSLKVGERTNPVRDPLAMQRTQSPLDNRIGLRRFDDRFTRDGFRFAPEFNRGNDIYDRSLLFDYNASTGWRVQNPNNRYPADVPTRPLNSGYGPRPLKKYPFSQSLSRPISTRVPSTQVPMDRAVSRPIPAVPAEPVLNEKQIVETFKSELKNRLEKAKAEKKIYGDIQGRNIVDSESPSSMAPVSNPEELLRTQLSEIPLRDFLKDFPQAVKILPFSDESRKELTASFQEFLKDLRAEIVSAENEKVTEQVSSQPSEKIDGTVAR